MAIITASIRGFFYFFFQTECRIGRSIDRAMYKSACILQSFLVAPPKETAAAERMDEGQAEAQNSSKVTNQTKKNGENLTGSCGRCWSSSWRRGPPMAQAPVLKTPCPALLQSSMPGGHGWQPWSRPWSLRCQAQGSPALQQA